MGFFKSILPILAVLSVGIAARAEAQSSPSAFTTGYRYDAQRRLVGTIEPDPDGPTGPLHYAATRNIYDQAGRLTKVEKGELASWQPESVDPQLWPGFTVLQRADTDYDALDRKVVERVSGLGTGESGLLVLKSLTQTSYDLDGRVDCTAARMDLAVAVLPDACTPTAAGANGPDRITRNIYDASGQLLQIRRAVGTGIEQAYATYHYTPNGHQDVTVDANGNRAEMHYDGFDRQDRWTFPSQTRPASFNPSTPDNALATAGAANAADYEFYTYDPNGNRLTLKKRDNTTIQYQYDALNRVYLKTVPTSATGAAGYSVYQGYDNRGLLLYARFGSAAGLGITNTYDNVGRLSTSTTSMDGVNRTFTSQYDADGNRYTLTSSEGYTAAFDYDGLDRMVAARESGTSGPVAATIAYDQLGRRGSLGQGPGGAVSSTAYAYDGASRLQTQTHDFVVGVSGADQVLGFSYNPASQIVQQTRTNASWEYNEAAPGTKNYATNGLNQYQQAGSATFQYDLNGNLSSDGTRAYVYDAENRLVSVTGDITSTLSYDPMGRLWRFTGPSSGDLRFVYDGDRLTEELNAAGAWQRVYVFGPGVDEPLLWDELAGGAVHHFLHADHQGSIVAVTDDSGNALAIDKYDEWGVPAAGNMSLQRFQYTGQAWLPDLGLYYYKARMYSSRLGRFLQTDPIGYKDQVNLYAYVGNDPVDGRDPTGSEEQKGFFAQLWSDIKNASALDWLSALASQPDEPTSAEEQDAEQLATDAAAVRAAQQAERIMGDLKVARYDRSLHYGNRTTTSPAARAARTAGEGRPCPSCSRTMTPGTKTAPSPQHAPPLVQHYYRQGGARMTDAERRAHAQGPGINGAQCRDCQNKEGGMLSHWAKALWKEISGQ